MRFHVPCRALAYVFGRNAMYGYRLEPGLGRFSVLGTTVKVPSRLPQDWVAESLPRRVKGVFSGRRSPIRLPKPRGDKLVWCLRRKPGRSTPTGWAATQGAWKRLFPTITIILCFWHAFLKIRDRATKVLTECFQPVSQKVCPAYRAPGKAAFAQRLRRRREWAEPTLPASPMKPHTLELCAKRAQFSRRFDYERAHRTRHLVDRLMR